MTKTGKLHFGLKIMFMKEDVLITMEIMEWGDKLSSIQLQPLAMVTVYSSRKVRTEGPSKVWLDVGTNWLNRCQRDRWTVRTQFQADHWCAHCWCLSYRRTGAGAEAGDKPWQASFQELAALFMRTLEKQLCKSYPTLCSKHMGESPNSFTTSQSAIK